MSIMPIGGLSLALIFVYKYNTAKPVVTRLKNTFKYSNDLKRLN
jgi:hypothetical protein